jgi:hypothetical protein
VKAPFARDNLSDAAAKLEDAVFGLGPLHQPRLDLGAVEPARRDIRLGHRGIRQRADGLAVVHGKARRLAERRGTQARSGPKRTVPSNERSRS